MLRDASNIVVQVFVGGAIAPDFIDGLGENASAD